jgi:hypothetical protein
LLPHFSAKANIIDSGAVNSNGADTGHQSYERGSKDIYGGKSIWYTHVIKFLRPNQISYEDIKKPEKTERENRSNIV